MIKLALLLALGALCVAQGAKFGTTGVADKDFLQKQKYVYELLFYVQQRDFPDAEFSKIGKAYSIRDNIGEYENKTVVLEFLSYYEQGALERNAIFSPYYEEHIQEVYLLYKLFLSARTFDTFYKTACWARYYMNDGVFTSAFTNAIYMYEKGSCLCMKLPAIYEIYPHLFFNSEVIQEARRIKMISSGSGINAYIEANSTAEHSKPFHDEYDMDYYLEDVSLNAYYYYVRQVFAYWLNTKEYPITKDIRGYMYYYLHKQLYARYYLERMSNDLGKIDDLDWYKPVYPGFYSSLTYSNGVSFPQRPRYSTFPYYKYKYLKEINVLESRIVSAIDSGYVITDSGKRMDIYTPEGFNYLANIIEGNRDSCNRRFYGMYDALARDILGFNYQFEDKNNVVPSALQCYTSSMRDPAFFMLYKKIMSFFFRYKSYLPQYTEAEIGFPGVEIKSTNVGNLTTYYGTCQYLINNAVAVESFEEGMKIRLQARRECLNYKPFTYKLNVKSEKKTMAIVKFFLGPAYDYVYQDFTYLQKYYKYFFELDSFVTKLNPGMNTIERTSPNPECPFTGPEVTPSEVYYKRLLSSLGGGEPVAYEKNFYGFPQHLILPKGKPEGMRYKMFYYLAPYDESQSTVYEFPMLGRFPYYGKPFGYPLDRPMYSPKYFGPNMFFEDVYIYHRDIPETYRY